MVQQELHPPDEGRQGDGDPGQPIADETAAGVSETLTATPAHASVIEATSLLEPRPRDGAEWDALVRQFRAAGDEALAWTKTLVSAGVYATLIVTFAFQIARVEGVSMAPTLANEDRLIVNKFAYLIGDPRPGDIVMLRYPPDPEKSFVKRVIAGEGDAVRIEDGHVYVNDVALADDFVPPEYRSHDDHETTVIPPGYYYVLGDHRNNSSDSRDWGVVPKKYITGKVQVRWWPLPAARVF